MYREIREVQSTLEALQSHIRDALLSTSTREMVEHNGRAQVSAVAAYEQIDTTLNGRRLEYASDFGEPRVDKRFVGAAQRALSEAISEAEKIALGTDVEGMRARVIDFKTRADFVDAYLRAALGTDLEA